jgi:hypothetical protein
MRLVRIRGSAIVAGALTLALAVLVQAPAAEANHGNAVKKCEQRYGGNFHHMPSLPIQADSGTWLGRLALSWAWKDGKRRTCAVVIRTNHGSVLRSSVKIKRAGSKRPPHKRVARSRFGVGPVAQRARCFKVRGTIGGGWVVLPRFCHGG